MDGGWGAQTQSAQFQAEPPQSAPPGYAPPAAYGAPPGSPQAYGAPPGPTPAYAYGSPAGPPPTYVTPSAPPLAYTTPPEPPQAYGSPAAPQGYGSPAAPQGYGSPAAPQAFGGQASPSPFGQPASAPPATYGTPASGPPAGGSQVPAPALPSWPQSTSPTMHGGYHPPPPQSAPPAEPERWGRDERGTTYGGPGGLGAGSMTTAMPAGNPVENSGSLTGHILSQGRADGPAPKSNTAKVLLIGAVLLAALVVIGLIAATVAGDAVSDMFGGVLDN
jgi:hypothetical protein